ncbi:MAG: hypothetical protein RMJ31_03120 [Nitrososphaerota archaeon]|nr:hypothetical protein [Nitrososphaerota archaeon]
MGGTKKRPLAQMEKAQLREATKKEATKKEAPRVTQQSKSSKSLTIKLNEDDIIKALNPLKAITLYNAAKSLGVTPSVASTLIKMMESKGLLKKVGGYSGHYVYALTTIT